MGQRILEKSNQAGEVFSARLHIYTAAVAAAADFGPILDVALVEARAQMPAIPQLDADQCLLLANYLRLVQQYDRVARLTAVAGEDLARELAAESLRLLALGEIAPGLHLLDLGSGNGSPV